MWPFRRAPQRILVDVKIEGLDSLTTAVMLLADNVERAAKIRTGWIHPKPKPLPPKPKVNEYEQKFRDWVHSLHVSDAERGDLIGLWESLIGKRSASPEILARARITLHAKDAPLPPGL